jgi:ribosomal protein S18 acetylase RimI-like enzyme
MSRLHVEHLPVGLFPSLGARFVARWHQAHIDSRHGVALVSYDPAADGEVTGFLVGAVDRAAFRVDLLTRHRRELVLHGAGALALRPRVLARFVRTRASAYLRRLRRSGTPDLGRGPAVADLTAIAVNPQRHRRGAGRALTEEFLRICAHAGAARAELVADDAASGFYERTGWQSGRSVTTRDDRSLRWFSIDLHPGRAR